METVGENQRPSGQPDEQHSVGVRGNSARNISFVFFLFDTCNHIETALPWTETPEVACTCSAPVPNVRPTPQRQPAHTHRIATRIQDGRHTLHSALRKHGVPLSLDVAWIAFFLRRLLWTITSVGRGSPVQSARHASTDRARCHRSGSSTWKGSPSFAKPEAFERDAWNEGARLRRVACRSLPPPISTSTPWDLDLPTSFRTILRRQKPRPRPPEER
mmetsp:Transcript_4951/g.31734  ORF Transcript_4951/g.31734 Transcript_4951/m.31734 type:complete len:217 (-) Transcript_4951:516-1166(-)